MRDLLNQTLHVKDQVQELNPFTLRKFLEKNQREILKKTSLLG